MGLVEIGAVGPVDTGGTGPVVVERTDVSRLGCVCHPPFRAEGQVLVPLERTQTSDTKSLRSHKKGRRVDDVLNRLDVGQGSVGSETGRV